MRVGKYDGCVGGDGGIWTGKWGGCSGDWALLGAVPDVALAAAGVMCVWVLRGAWWRANRW
jgi:hypothetical protein